MTVTTTPDLFSPDSQRSPGTGRDESVRRAESLELRRQVSDLAAIFDLVARIESADSLRRACQTVVDQIQRYVGARQVMIGLCRSGSMACRLVGVSQIASFHPQDRIVLRAQAVLQEVIARGKSAHWPARDMASRGGLEAHRRFAEDNGTDIVVSGILCDSFGELQGAWLATFSKDHQGVDLAARFLRTAETPVAAALRLLGRSASRTILRVVQDKFQMLLSRKRLVMIAIVAMLLGMLGIPWQYRPRCTCTIEPATRRFIAAPFSGPLALALVEPGDEVAEGQVLARMDGREIHWELAGIRADLNRVTSERAGHIATHASGQAELTRFEVDRLRSRIELLEHREQNLEICSPITGVVVHGDWKDAAGIPLETGKSLFEVAPLDEMIVQVAIREDDFEHVRRGMKIRIVLDACPLRTLMAVLERIQPRAEIRDDENVFIGEARLENRSGQLRPGMKGAVKVEGPQMSIGWILFRRPLAAVCRWVGW